MVIHERIPEESLLSHGISPTNPALQHSLALVCQTYLIPIPPKEILRPNIHKRILDPVLNILMRLVLPVLLPQAPRVDGGDDEGGDRHINTKLPPEICASEALAKHKAVGVWSYLK